MPKLRIGMVGGGPDAFIGAVHRIALNMDGDFELVAGAFSSDPEKSRQTGEELGLAPSRVYGSWIEMAEKESQLPEGERIDAVSIVTPNHVHAGPIIEFMNMGFHVICDKPLTTSSENAEDIRDVVNGSDRVFALTHNYIGYPIIREARDFVQGGGIGKVQKVYAEYLQGWLVDALEETGQKQASWRTDPNQSGPGGSLGDIGTHAFNLLEHISGEKVTRVMAQRRMFVPGRRVDDDAMVMMELSGGGNGMLCSSQVCSGRENGLKIRIFGTEGGIEWDQEHPNDLKITYKDKGSEIRRPGNAYLGEDTGKFSRTPAGHPEGYLEAFANIYRWFARSIRGEENIPESYASIEDGIRGVRFIEAAIESSDKESWIDF